MFSRVPSFREQFSGGWSGRTVWSGTVGRHRSWRPWSSGPRRGPADGTSSAGRCAKTSGTRDLVDDWCQLTSLRRAGNLRFRRCVVWRTVQNVVRRRRSCHSISFCHNTIIMLYFLCTNTELNSNIKQNHWSGPKARGAALRYVATEGAGDHTTVPKLICLALEPLLNVHGTRASTLSIGPSHDIM